MTMANLVTFVTRTIGGLPEDKRDAVRVLFHNPTDAAVGVFEQFAAWDGIEALDEIIQTAKALGIDNAGAIEDAWMEWTNTTCAPAEDACPTCGNRPGDGVGCADPNGCGAGADVRCAGCGRNEEVVEVAGARKVRWIKLTNGECRACREHVAEARADMARDRR